ncbi:CRISPR-associated endonuclease Cas2 [Acidiplasma aeolicum]|jgi:CRISPR-associated protein Cas2|uniref:CRISPR-associated endonuclease Cas2 n=1 Tax=Acidiplasma aeolicum TaxID=507754 RepID=UPI00371264DB
MYIILVYDVGEKRVSKVNKYLKRYLLWRQNSVFEGEITDKLLDRMISGVNKILKDQDSLIIYKFKVKSYIENIILGNDKGNTDNVI